MTPPYHLGPLVETEMSFALVLAGLWRVDGTGPGSTKASPDEVLKVSKSFKFCSETDSLRHCRICEWSLVFVDMELQSNTLVLGALVYDQTL